MPTTMYDNDTTKVTPAKNITPLSPFLKQEVLENVCSMKNGALVLFATDEWFAKADNLINDMGDTYHPVFDPNAYCEQGKVLDGWETRRRRETGHDWCLIQLSRRCLAREIRGIEIDTAHFTGNQVPNINIEIIDLQNDEDHCRTKEVPMISQLPGAISRLLRVARSPQKEGGIQGTGWNPMEVEQAEKACREVVGETQWKELLPITPLQPGYEETRMHYFYLNQDGAEQPPTPAGTHIRVNYFPDGGVARLRIWCTKLKQTTEDPYQYQPKPMELRPLYTPITTGKVCTVISHDTKDVNIMPSQQPDYPYSELSSLENGGTGLQCSNKHYGEPWQLIQSRSGKDMGDGWETARHPNRPWIVGGTNNGNKTLSDWARSKLGLGNNVTSDDTVALSDWALLKLGGENGAQYGIRRIIIDTKHFKGNYPESITLQGCCCADGTTTEDFSTVEWFPLIERCRMSPHSEHVFDNTNDYKNSIQILNSNRHVTHVKLSIYPDGGISRVRIYGPTTKEEAEEDTNSSKL